MFSLYNWDCRLSARPLDGYLMHLGLYELQRDQDRLLQRTATPLVARYRQHMAAPMPLIRSPLVETAK